MKLIFVKVGGNLIAPKDKKFELDLKVLKEFSKQFKRVKKEFPHYLFILGNGGGSFGHLPAVESNFKGLIKKEKFWDAGFIHRKVTELNTYFVAKLQEEGIVSFQFLPASFIVTCKGKVKKINSNPLFSALELGVVPVVYGDVVLDEFWNFSIISTEKIFKFLVFEAIKKGYKVERVVHIGNYKGVFSKEGEVIRLIRASQLKDIEKELFEISEKDITGGMKHKVKEACFLAKKGIEVNIISFSFGENNLLKVLEKKEVGTKIVP